MKVHRWQPTGKTPCGRIIDAATPVNWGKSFDDGVTCVSCKKNPTRISIWGQPAPSEPIADYGRKQRTAAGSFEPGMMPEIRIDR